MRTFTLKRLGNCNKSPDPDRPRLDQGFKLELVQSEYRQYLLEKFRSKAYAMHIYHNSLKYSYCLTNPSEIAKIPASIRGNILKAMANFAKFLCVYVEYQSKLKNSGVKWLNNYDAFNSFLRMTNHKFSSLGEWYRAMQGILKPYEKLYLRYMLVTGLRMSEGIKSFNLIQKLAKDGNLDSYYNNDLGILEHYKIQDANGDFLFIKKTKKLYISFVSRELLSAIINSKPISYNLMRKRINRHNYNIRTKELRAYFASYLRKHNILAEWIDLLQGRIGKSVFAKHYLKLENIKELGRKVNAITATIERSLLS